MAIPPSLLAEIDMGLALRSSRLAPFVQHERLDTNLVSARTGKLE